jgi:hypothetical protein
MQLIHAQRQGASTMQCGYLELFLAVLLLELLLDALDAHLVSKLDLVLLIPSYCTRVSVYISVAVQRSLV